MVQKMKLQYALVFSLFAVLAVAGCVQFGQQASLGNPQLTQSTQDLILQTEFYPEEVKTGKEMNLGFLIEAKKPLQNVNLNIYDTCLFSVKESPQKMTGNPRGGNIITADKDNTTIDLIQANTTKVLKFKLTAGQTEFERDCNIAFKISYEANASVTQDFVVLSDAEYMERQRAGTLSAFDISYFKTDSPLDMALSFSEPQPFQNATEIYMNIDYTNIGSGFLDKLEKNSVEIVLPNNIEKSECNDFTQGKLNKEKKFINNKAPSSTCKLITKTSRAVDAKRITVNAKYKYNLDNYITVKIKPK